MTDTEKSYLEIKVTFIHVLVLLVAVILIGIFLFYLGFQAGKSSIKNQFAHQSVQENTGKTEKIEIQEEAPVIHPGRKSGQGQGIENEMQLHSRQDPAQIPIKPIQKESYYSIQVGAYADFANARKESEKYSKLGYQTEILSTILKKQKLFRVRVGKFTNLEKAEKAKIKLEKQEKQNFDIVNPD